MPNWQKNTQRNKASVQTFLQFPLIDMGLRSRLKTALLADGYIVVPADYFSADSSLEESKFELFRSWENLEKDNYLKGDHQFRYRRYGRFHFQLDKGIKLLPHAAFYQSTENNSYAGGISREFSPLERPTRENKFLKELIRLDFSLLPLDAAQQKRVWELDVHQYRIIGNVEHSGEPTPEGIHNDGFDYFAVHLIKRQNVQGGISTVYNNVKEPLSSLTLKDPLDSMIVEDRRVMHSVTAVTPDNVSQTAVRDVLVINFIARLRNLKDDNI